MALADRAWRERSLVVLVGVVAGYICGRVLEHELGWANAIVLTMPAGGLLTGIAARFILKRFAPRPPGAGEEPRPRRKGSTRRSA